MTMTTEIHVVRLPILDRQNALFGYDLIFRPATGASASGSLGDYAGPGIESVLSLELGRIADGRPAMVTVDRATLLSGALGGSTPGALIVALEEGIPGDDEVTAACESLKAKGFRLALDGFYYDGSQNDLLALADIVKLETLAMTRVELQEQATLLKPFGVRLMAEQVESDEDYEDCVGMGFDLFQGFHYLSAIADKSQGPSESQLAVMRILSLLGDPDIGGAQIEDAFKADPTLSYKLLKMVNSAAVGGRAVDSIAHALRLLGRGTVHRWLALIMASSYRGESAAQLEIIKSTLLRARLCELIHDLPGGAAAELPNKGALFIVGLFSHMHVLLGQPLETTLEGINLPEHVVRALLDREGPAGQVLNAVEAYEGADWDRAEEELAALSLATDGMSDKFLEALTWASEQLVAHGDA